MPRRITLHVGPPKTATTYLQRTLQASAPTLAGRGITVLASQPELRDAASDLIGRSPRPGALPPDGAWERLCARVAGISSDVVISCERFSLLLAHHAEAVREAWSADLRVVLTLRDGAAHLASRWQERVKNGGTEAWPEFCSRIAEDGAFRDRMLRMRAPLEAWSEALAPEKIHVVTVPLPGAPRELVAERFGEVIGVPVSALTSATGAVAANTALGAAETELVRRLNVATRDSLGPDARRTEIRGFLTEQLLPPHGGRLRVDPLPEAFDAAREESRTLVSAIRAADHPVHGDLDELVHHRRPVDPVTTVPEGAVADAAVTALAAMTRRAHEARRHPEPTAPPRGRTGRRRRR